jgi:hypothetical protein
VTRGYQKEYEKMDSSIVDQPDCNPEGMLRREYLQFSIKAGGKFEESKGTVSLWMGYDREV